MTAPPAPSAAAGVASVSRAPRSRRRRRRLVEVSELRGARIRLRGHCFDFPCSVDLTEADGVEMACRIIAIDPGVVGDAEHAGPIVEAVAHDGDGAIVRDDGCGSAPCRRGAPLRLRRSSGGSRTAAPSRRRWSVRRVADGPMRHRRVAEFRRPRCTCSRTRGRRRSPHRSLRFPRECWLFPSWLTAAHWLLRGTPRM